MNFYEKLAYRMGQKKAEDEALSTTEDIEGAGGYGLSPKRVRDIYKAVWETPDIEMTPAEIKRKHRNAWIGGTLGGVGGGALGALAAHQLPNARLGEHIGGGLIGAMFGIPLGALLGYGKIPTSKGEEFQELREDVDSGPLVASLSAAADRMFQMRKLKQQQKTSALRSKLALTPGLGDQTYYESPEQKKAHPKPTRPLVPQVSHSIQPASEPRGVAGTALY